MLFIVAWVVFWVTLIFAIKLEELSIKGALVLGGLWVAAFAAYLAAAVLLGGETAAPYSGWLMAAHAILAAVTSFLALKGMAGNR